jgi:hypothetical protein
MRIIEEQDVQENLDRDMVDKSNVDLKENGIQKIEGQERFGDVMQKEFCIFIR